MEKTDKPEKTQKAPKTPKSHRAGLGTRIILRIVTILLIAVLVLGGGYFAFKRFTVVRKQSNIALVERQLSYCQELVTAKYRYSDIISLKKTSGFAKSYTIIKYSGLIRAGVADITDISYSVSLDGKTITLTIPPAEILGNEIVSQSVFDEKQSIFVPISTQEVFNEIDEAKNAAAQDMVAEGILDDARDYAIRIVTQFMLALGFEEVKIR